MVVPAPFASASASPLFDPIPTSPSLSASLVALSFVAGHEYAVDGAAADVEKRPITPHRRPPLPTLKMPARASVGACGLWFGDDEIGSRGDLVNLPRKKKVESAEALVASSASPSSSASSLPLSPPTLSHSPSSSPSNASDSFPLDEVVSSPCPGLDTVKSCHSPLPSLRSVTPPPSSSPAPPVPALSLEGHPAFDLVRRIKEKHRADLSPDHRLRLPDVFPSSNLLERRRGVAAAADIPRSALSTADGIACDGSFSLMARTPSADSNISSCAVSDTTAGEDMGPPNPRPRSHVLAAALPRPPRPRLSSQPTSARTTTAPVSFETGSYFTKVPGRPDAVASGADEDPYARCRPRTRRPRPLTPGGALRGRAQDGNSDARRPAPAPAPPAAFEPAGGRPGQLTPDLDDLPLSSKWRRRGFGGAFGGRAGPWKWNLGDVSAE